MRNVRDVLREKGSDIWTVRPEITVYDALVLMAEKNIGAVVVLDGDDRLAGIFSERDYARKVILKGKSSQETTIDEVMTHGVLTVSPSRSIDECMALMTDRHIRHLPVVDDDRLVGMISIGDVMKAAIADREVLIEQLEHYITPAY